MHSNLLALADAAVGDRVDALVAAHHRRRLDRVGWARAFEPASSLWADGEPPPRPGNEIEIMIDGASFLPRLADELARAESHVHIAGWYLSTELALEREGGRRVLLDLLAELAQKVDVRVLLWAGAPLPLFKPSRADVREVAERLRAAGVQVALDAKERPLHCHHEKLVVVDTRVASVGGIDLTTFHGDRYDSSEHPWRPSLRWREVTGDELPAAELPAESGDHELQLVQTIPEKVYRARPRGAFRILETYVRALRSAERLIYLESQFLWSPELVAILVDKLRRPPRDDFRIVAVQPSHPASGDDDSRGQVGVLVDADEGAGRFLACSLYARSGERRELIYVHAKIGIVDDVWLTIGSANLNEHSLFNDSEVNLVSREPELARTTRERLWAEHLELPIEDVRRREPGELIAERWFPIAEEQLDRR